MYQPLRETRSSWRGGPPGWARRSSWATPSTNTPQGRRRETQWGRSSTVFIKSRCRFKSSQAGASWPPISWHKSQSARHHHYRKSRPRKFQLMCDILMSVTSLVFASKLSTPSTMSSNTNSHMLSMVRHVESINSSHVNQHSHSILNLC